MKSKTFIKIRTQFEGVHHWPTAPAEVAHLQSPHRHTFYITLQIEVYHNDRELEFFMVKDFVDYKVVRGLVKEELGRTSCEDLNDHFYEALRQKYGDNRIYIIETSEDRERSALSYYNTE